MFWKFKYQLVGKKTLEVTWEGLTGAAATDTVTYLFYENGFGKRRIEYIATGRAKYGEYQTNNSYYAETVWPWVQGSNYLEDISPENIIPDPIKYSGNVIKFERRKK